MEGQLIHITQHYIWPIDYHRLRLLSKLHQIEWNKHAERLYKIWFGNLIKLGGNPSQEIKQHDSILVANQITLQQCIFMRNMLNFEREYNSYDIVTKLGTCNCDIMVKLYKLGININVSLDIMISILNDPLADYVFKNICRTDWPWQYYTIGISSYTIDKNYILTQYSNDIDRLVIMLSKHNILPGYVKLLS